MTDDLTPWEEINPMTVSAQRRGPPCKSSAPDDHRTIFRNELTACLTLTAPVGMTEEAKRDWFAVAWETLKDIPPDILAIGAKKARLRCDHPSKIVPAIFEETREMRKWHGAATEACTDPSRLLAAPEYCSPEEAAKILSDYGLKRDWSGEIAGNNPTNTPA